MISHEVIIKNIKPLDNQGTQKMRGERRHWRWAFSYTRPLSFDFIFILAESNILTTDHCLQTVQVHLNAILNLNDHVDIHKNVYQGQASTDLQICLHEHFISPTN